MHKLPMGNPTGEARARATRYHPAPYPYIYPDRPGRYAFGPARGGHTQGRRAPSGTVRTGLESEVAIDRTVSGVGKGLHVPVTVPLNVANDFICDSEVYTLCTSSAVQHYFNGPEHPYHPQYIYKAYASD